MSGLIPDWAHRALAVEDVKRELRTELWLRMLEGDVEERE